MTPYHRIADTPPPIGAPVLVFWWGDNAWITATWTGDHWQDEQGRIVREPVLYWKRQ